VAQSNPASRRKKKAQGESSREESGKNGFMAEKGRRGGRSSDFWGDERTTIGPGFKTATPRGALEQLPERRLKLYKHKRVRKPPFGGKESNIEGKAEGKTSGRGYRRNTGPLLLGWGGSKKAK